MADDDWLRIASDPRTAPEAVARLARFVGPNARVRHAAARNPSLPLGDLAALLLLSTVVGYPTDIDVAAWHNPSVTLAMLVHPDERYPVAAQKVLSWLASRRVAPQGLLPRDLRHVLWLWSNNHNRTVGHDEVRAFAQHLAGLFSIPWPVPAP